MAELVNTPKITAALAVVTVASAAAIISYYAFHDRQEKVAPLPSISCLQEMDGSNTGGC